MSPFDFITPGFEDLELSTQVVIKEALRRGIQVDVLDRADNFIRLKKGGKTEYVKQATKTSADSYITALIMENKVVTKTVLEEAGIRVPKGDLYHDKVSAMADAERWRGKNIVVKPNRTNFGIGVSIMKSPWSKKDYEKKVDEAFGHDHSVIVEEFIEGEEYRFLVISDKTVAVLRRIPANVVGDGTRTIRELVEEKNKDPLRGKGYKTPLEKIRLGQEEKDFLDKQSKTFDTVPQKNEQVFLRENSNISTGGDSVDYTDEVAEGYKQIAVQAAKAVGAAICGADIVIKDIKAAPNDSNHGIIELNFNPALHIHNFPFRGKNRHTGAAMLDLLGF